MKHSLIQLHLRGPFIHVTFLKLEHLHHIHGIIYNIKNLEKNKLFQNKFNWE